MTAQRTEADEVRLRELRERVKAAAPLEDYEARSEGLGKGALVRACSPEFRGRQRRYLRALGHHVDATLQIGHQGLHETLAEALDRALLDHELVKLRCLDAAPCTSEAAALWIHDMLGARVVQLLGRTLLVYRAHPEKPRISVPG